MDTSNEQNTEPKPIEEVTLEDIPQEEEIHETPPIEEVPKKKPGRPKDSKDRAPRPKRKAVVIKEEPIPDIEEPQDLPRPLQGSQPILDDETDKAALMLQLLKHQAQVRKNRKSELYASWFR